MPDPFLSIKLLHICAVIGMVGATVINGMIHGAARSLTPTQAEPMLALVLRINRLVMAPSLIALPVTGGLLVWLTSFDPSALWVWASTLLSVALLGAYVLGARVERQLHLIAMQDAQAGRQDLSPDYQSTFRQAAAYGIGALVMSVLALILMIFKS